MLSDRKTHNPIISVIVTAFNRTEYVDRALQSVRYQNVDPSLVEVILVSNFRYNLNWSSPFNRFLSFQTEGSIGEYLYEALNRSTGQIISFLDDDDVWEETKLRNVLQEFSTDPALVYLHNSVKYINDLGTGIMASRLSDSKFSKNFYRGIKFNSTNFPRYVKHVLSTGGDFNLSSISIHRKIAEFALPYLRKINGGTDTFFFWFSIASGSNLLITQKELTRYGIHAHNSSRASISEAKSLELKKLTNTYTVILSFINNEQVQIKKELAVRWISALINQYDLLILDFSNASKLLIFTCLKRLVICYFEFLYSSMERIILFTFLYLLFPKLATKLYFRFLENMSR